MAKKYKCRVEYLESTGTQWIDTGVIQAGVGLKAELTLARTGNSTSEQAFVGRTAGNGYELYINNNVLGLWNSSGKYVNGIALTQNVAYNVVGYIYSTGISLTVDGSTYSWTGTPGDGNLPTTATVTLFFHNGQYYVTGKIYYCKLWNNGVLVRDFIPVLDNSGRPAMYDQVSGQLFYNQGTGEFTYGRQIIPVEYLESTGTQYINTDVCRTDTGYSTGDDLTSFSFKGIVEYTSLGVRRLMGDSGVNNGFWGIAANNKFETGTTSTYTASANTKYKIDFTATATDMTLVVNLMDGTEVLNFSRSATVPTKVTSVTFDIFALGGNFINSGTRIYKYQILINGNLLRDYTPAIDENNTPFMFDLVTNTCYLNAGTGQFKVGPNVEKVWSGKKLRRKLALALANLKKKRKYYCEVEYLESTGTQYIDTGVKWVGDNHKISIGFFKDDITTAAQTAVCGFQGGTGNNELFAIYYGNLYVYGGNGDTTGRIRNGVWLGNVHNNIDVVLNNDTVTYVLNGDSAVSYTARTNYVDIDKTMYLFRNNNSTFQCLTGKIYYCKIWENNVLVRDMIPVLDWNYVPCMFDRVTEQLFYNAGSGNFTAGREIHPVDYLESTGVEYVDTGIKFDGANTKIELKTYEDSLTRRHSICGDDGNFFYYFRGTGNWAVGYNGTAANIDTYMSVGDNVFVIDKNNVYVNGVLAKTYTASSNVSSYNALLFNRKTSLVDNGAVTMYYCKIWNNNVLVRDYIPAISEDGTPFMFDRVSHTCFLNQGTGAFKYPAREVEYLQSDGARAIIAGMTVDDTCGYDVKWMALNADDRIILGTKGSGDSRWVLSGGNNPNVNLSWNTSSGGVGLGLNKIQTAQMNYFNDRKRILNDTPLADINTTLSANASTYNVGIFAGYWGASTISLYSTCRIYYAKISKGTELIRDFIPMIKDGSPCLYDKVGGEYYFGIGTGSFSKGKIVEPEYE